MQTHRRPLCERRPVAFVYTAQHGMVRHTSTSESWGVTVVCTRRFCHDAQEDHKDRYEQRIAGEVRKPGAEVRPS